MPTYKNSGIFVRSTCAAPQVLNLHDAFLQGDWPAFRAYLPEIEAYMELLRPGEAAMLANHLARAPSYMKYADDVERMWQKIKEHAEDILCDCEGHTVSILLNAYAIGKRVDRDMIDRMQKLVTLRASDMDARSCCMVMNAFARLEATDNTDAIEAVVTQVKTLAPQFNSLDCATASNALAKMQLPPSRRSIRYATFCRNNPSGQ